jgi:hypothetical protein
MDGLSLTRRSSKGEEGSNPTLAVYVAMLVVTCATVTVHVGRITSAVHVGCAGIADGISVAVVTGSRMGVLVALGAAVAVPGLIGVTVCVFVLMGTRVIVTVLVPVGRGVEDGTSVDSGANVTGLVGFGLAVFVGTGTTVWVGVLMPAGTKPLKVTSIELLPVVATIDIRFAVTSRYRVPRPASTFNGQSVSAAQTSTASNPRLVNRITALFIQAPFYESFSYL